MSATPSPLKSETARVNGAQSHGPVTAEGKAHSGFSALCATKETAKSSQNALRHGLCSKESAQRFSALCAVQQSAVLPGEDQAEFDRRKASYFETYKPQTDVEKDQVEIIINTTWRLKRIMRLESNLLVDENTDPLQALAHITRYEGQLNRAHPRALAHLKELQQARLESARRAASPSQRNEPKPAAPGPQMSPAEIKAFEQDVQNKGMEQAIHDYIMGPIPGYKPLGGPR